MQPFNYDLADEGKGHDEVGDAEVLVLVHAAVEAEGDDDD